MLRSPLLLQLGALTILACTLAAPSLETVLQRQSPSISWSKCPDSNVTQCAVLDVPRDYANPSDSDTVSIFMRRFPGDASEENKLGTIITNPGGPGGSGSHFVALAGEMLSTLLEGRYDIVGFDSRGVNLTEPWTGCFASETESLLLEYQLDILGVPYPHTTIDDEQRLVSKISAIQYAHNAACMHRGNRQMLESVGTASVVQDMVRIVEALGEDGLNYWGFSYGAILGATFAAMRPDLVKRMVLDGVSNAESYHSDIWQWGRDGMQDTNKTFDGFLSLCAEAGPSRCAFAMPPGNLNAPQTTETLRKRIDAIYARLDTQPVVVANAPSVSVPGPGIFTASNLQKLLLITLYSPVDWTRAMQALADLEGGDGTSAYVALTSPYVDMTRQQYDQSLFNRSMQRYLTRESLRPILCSDTAPVNVSIDAYTDYFRELGKLNSLGEQWAAIMGGCNGWSFRANQRYTGPWTVAEGLKKTRFPILFMSLTADPITPLASAAKMARGFGNESATLLVQEGYGHSTIAHPSLCTYGHVYDYFIGGKVPANGTFCTPDPDFIYPANDSMSKRAKLHEPEMQVLRSLEDLQKVTLRFILG